MSTQPTEPAAPQDRSDLGLLAQIQSFNAVYWIANVMEMFERLAYFGLRTVLPIYMVLSLEEGGPQFDHIQKGAIYAWWALVQSGLPVFTGGYADRRLAACAIVGSVTPDPVEYCSGHGFGVPGASPDDSREFLYSIHYIALKLLECSMFHSCTSTSMSVFRDPTWIQASQQPERYY